MEIIVVVVLSLVVGGQWLLIWRLLDRLLMSKSIPSLGPVRSKEDPTPVERPKPVPLMTLEIPD
jgi:hypothetical protein